MRLRTALSEYPRRQQERFPAERPTTEGAFTGDGDRLIHVGADGSLHDCSYPLSGLGGLDRLRLGISTDDDIRWLDTLSVTRQHYDGDTPLVETAYDAGRYTVHQFDLTIDRVHLTHVELRGTPPVDPELVAVCAFAPDMVEGRVGQLVHENAGPNGGAAVEVFHRSEHDFLTASTGISTARGRRQESIADLRGDSIDEFSRRGEIDSHEDAHLTGEMLVRAPFEHDGRSDRTTLVTSIGTDEERGPDADGRHRGERLESLRDTARKYDDTDALRAAADDRIPNVDESVPRRHQVSADLRTLELLRAPSGARIAAPEFDPFYTTSGGYGYTWFRDDAEVALAMLEAGTAFDIDVDDDLLASARFYCRTQDADGGWPHRVWADTGKLAPGWANARIEGASRDGSPDADDQLDQPATVVSFLATLLRTTDVPEDLRDRVVETIDDGVAFLESTVEEGLPRRCQNAWENANGQFTHTAAAYLRAAAAVERTPVPKSTRKRAAALGDDLVEGLDRLWLPDETRYARRLDDGSIDPTPDASTFAIVDAVLEYENAIREREGSADAGVDRDVGADQDAGIDLFVRARKHLEETIPELHRTVGETEGLVRFRGDDWRRAEQSTPKVWSVATLWGAKAAADLGARIESEGGDADDLFELARDLYELCEPDGPFTNGTGLIAEQRFDDGDLDSAVPLGWSHALRLSTTAVLSRNAALPMPHERPTAPDEAPQWTSGRKFGLGTTADHDDPDSTRVWFTLTEGALTEARFPRIDVMNLRTMDVLVADPETGYTARTFDETRRDDLAESIERTTEPTTDDALAYRQRIRETDDGHGHEWELVVEYAVDPDGETLLADVSFESSHEYDLYVLVDAAITNDGSDDLGERVGEDDTHLVARNAHLDREPGRLTDAEGDPFDVALGVTSTGGFDWASAVTADDEGLAELFATGTRGPEREQASGNVVLVGSVGSGTSVEETVAVGFAEDADTAAALGEAEGSLSRGFDSVRKGYVRGWREWITEYDPPSSVAGDDELATLYRFALMTLGAVEDKTTPGAGIASPSVPWGETELANEERGFGYNFVWSRDLYQVFTVLDAIGGTERAVDAVTYLYTVQQDKDGFLPQNTYIDGQTRWGGEQLDNIAFPSVMAWHLYDREIGFDDVEYGYDHVRRSVTYLVRNGPSTRQERWEEESGYSPSTIAAEIAGLVTAASIADSESDDPADPHAAVSDSTAEIRQSVRIGELASSPDRSAYRADALVWLALADEWAERVEQWCATEEGTARFDETPYYVRISRNGDPDAGHSRTIANYGPTYDEREIVDAGFLELVRLGVKPADDPVVVNSLDAVDRSIRVDTPQGPAWYRYVGDAYGELGIGDAGAPWHGGPDGRGRLWPIFTGERGEYELRARGDGPDGFGGTDEPELAPEALLETMAGFANDGWMLPEQVWDREAPTDYNWEFGEGTGAATPLAWSMAGFVRLAHGIDAGEPIETPWPVRERYVEHDLPTGPDLRVETRHDAEDLVVSGTTDGAVVAVSTAGRSILVEPDDDRFEVRIETGRKGDTIVVAAATDGTFERAGTSVERRRL